DRHRRLALRAAIEIGAEPIVLGEPQIDRTPPAAARRDALDVLLAAAPGAAVGLAPGAAERRGLAHPEPGEGLDDERQPFAADPGPCAVERDRVERFEDELASEVGVERAARQA